MERQFIPIGVTLASLLASGCSGGYYVDAAQYIQRTGTIVDDPLRGARAARSDRSRTVRATTQGYGTVSDGGQNGSSPNRGTSEGEQVQAQEGPEDERVRNAINSICRGC
jgi:hypothetical protein